MEKAPLVVFDRDRLVGVCRATAEAWQGRTLGLNGMEPPEVLFRPEHVQVGSREHMLWLFWFGWLNRSGKTADELGRVARPAMTEDIGLVDPLVYEPTPERLVVLEKIIPFAVDRLGRAAYYRPDWWTQTMEVVRDEFGGDPCNALLRHAAQARTDVWGAREAMIADFERCRGVGHKIAQMLVLWYQEAHQGSNSPDWRTVGRVPMIAADVWLCRLVRMMGCVVAYTSDHRDKVSRLVADEIATVCLENDINHIDFAQGAWHILARLHGIARGRKVTAVDRAGVCAHSCPLDSFCVGTVRPSREQTGRGSIGWDTLTDRERVLRLFGADDLADGARHKPHQVRQGSGLSAKRVLAPELIQLGFDL